MICEALFVAGCVIAASSADTAAFGAGSVLLGFATGLLLVIALPPVVRRFPPRNMPVTAACINIGFFGAVTAGPLVGGAIAYAHGWRWFYGGLAALGFAVLVAALFTLPDVDPPNRDQRFDFSAIALGLAATGLAFWGAAELAGHPFRSVLFMVPLAAGVVAFVALLLTQYHKDDALAPIKPMWNTAPIAGVLVAMFGGAALVTFTELLERFQIDVAHSTPLATGLLFWPEVLGTIVAAIALGAVLRTRFLVLLPLAGMIVLIAAGALLLYVSAHASHTLMLVMTGLLGLGAGATVAPALWVAGFSLPSQLIGRTFSLVELVRSEADFIIAPVIIAVAGLVGTRNAAGITLLLTIVATVGIVAIYISGGVGLPKPDIEAWLQKPEEKRPAIRSPELGTVARAR
jgi:hypothetical protein